jgi:hypothetical protein
MKTVMKVKELIKQLKEFDGDCPAVVDTGEYLKGIPDEEFTVDEYSDGSVIIKLFVEKKDE